MSYCIERKLGTKNKYSYASIKCDVAGCGYVMSSPNGKHAALAWAKREGWKCIGRGRHVCNRHDMKELFIGKAVRHGKRS